MYRMGGGSGYSRDEKWIYLVCIYVRTQFPTLDDHAEEDFRAKLTSVVQHLAPGHHLDLKFSSDEKHGEDVKVSVSVHDS